MNKVCLVGRITTKPEIKYTSSNIAFTRFSVAINRTFSNAQGQREADFINILVWRKQAENVCNYLDKGSLVSIDGRIQTGSFDGQDGKKVYTFDVVADSVQFLESKNKGSNNSGMYENQMPSAPNINIANDPFAEFGDSVSFDDNFLD